MADTGEKFAGKIKWYSIRKAWGYVTPTTDKAPTTDDIFFHQTSINSEEKNKWLDTDYEVEFTIYTDDEGRYKCKTVSAADGSPCVIAPRPPRKRGKGKKPEDGENGDATNGDGEKKAANPSGRQPRKRFDTDISVEIKDKMKEKKFDMRQTSLLVTVDKARIKFGPDGYAALAHADGVMAEGTFVCDDEGKVTITWNNMLKYEGEEWKTQDVAANSAILLGSVDFFDDNVGGMKQVETPESLWGEGKTDETEALESNKFQMRKCFLAKVPGKPRGARRPRTRGKKGGAGKGADATAEAGEKKEEAGEVKENGVKTEEAASS